MEKINFEEGIQVSPAKVMIDNIEHEVTPAIWKGNTPLSPFVLNKLQDNIGNAIENKRLKIEGKSEQAVRNGKNKLKITNFTDKTTDGVTFTAKFSNNKELEYIEAKGNSTTGYNAILVINISDLPAGDYIINGLGTNKVIRYVLLKNNDTEPKIITNDGDIRFTQDSSSPYIRFRIDLYMAGEINTKIRPMIRQASITDNTYEPYGVSPSPDYHSRIRNVGDNVNEFSSDLEIGEINNTTGLNVSNGNAIRTKDYIKVKPNTTYTIKNSNNYMNIVYFYTTDKTFINYSYSTDTSYTFSTDSTTKYIKVRSSSTNIQNNLTTRYVLVEGQIVANYNEYGCGSIDYIGQNKNLGYVEYYNKTRGYKNGNLTDNTSYNTYKAIVEGNTQYTISFEGTENLVSNLCYFDINMKYIKGDPFNSGNPRILTTPENCKYITLAVNHDITNFMIEKGKINTDFIEHQEKNIHISLIKGQVIHKDDYIVNNKIHQKRKTIALKGTESWALSNNYTNNSRFSLMLNDIKINAKVLSSHFQEGVGGTDTENIDAAGNNQRLMITIRNSIATTVAQLKEYLAEQYANDTPVIVEYELAEEIVTPLTKEQIEGIYELQKGKYVDKMKLTCLNEIESDLTDVDKSLEESLLDIEKLLEVLSLNS